MRHASHVDGTLTAEGIADCVEIGGALRQVIADLGIEPSPETLRVMYAPSSEAWQSAEVATREVGSHVKLESATVLQPPKGALSLDRTALDESVNAAVKCILKGEQKIVLVVGHLPLLSWVARRLVGVALPIGRAELLAIDVAAAADREKRTGILRWTLTPERRSKELIVEIREKIKSKMEAAKYLASFVTATLGVQVALMFEPAKLDALQKSGGSAQAPMLAFSAVLMSLSAALYFVTVFAYDKLLMPPTLWADSAPESMRSRPSWLVSRPPSSAAWILLQNMQRVWSLLFTWATVLLLAAIILQIIGVFYGRLRWPMAAVVVAGSLAAMGALILSVVVRGWPRLGSED